MAALGEARERYLTKTVAALPDADRALLRAYFDADMSLKQTAEALYLHKNTLQYRVRRVQKCLGLLSYGEFYREYLVRLLLIRVKQKQGL